MVALDDDAKVAIGKELVFNLQNKEVRAKHLVIEEFSCQGIPDSALDKANPKELKWDEASIWVIEVPVGTHVEYIYFFIFPSYIGAIIPKFQDASIYSNISLKLKEIAKKCQMPLHIAVLKGTREELAMKKVDLE